jgi:hypothetical protein
MLKLNSFFHRYVRKGFAGFSGIFRCSSSFYDSQSGKHVQLKDTIQIHLIAPNTHFGHIYSASGDTVPKLPTASSDVDSLLIADAFSISSNRLQTVTGNIADAGFNTIILGDIPKIMNITDDDDILEALETVLWNDVEGLPMSYRIGIRFIPFQKKHVEVALDMNVRHFQIQKDDFDVLLPILHDHNVEYEIHESN